jgi:hypothetical protein
MLYPLSYGRLALFDALFDCGPAEARGFEPPVPFKGDNSLASIFRAAGSVRTGPVLVGLWG